MRCVDVQPPHTTPISHPVDYFAMSILVELMAHPLTYSLDGVCIADVCSILQGNRITSIATDTFKGLTISGEYAKLYVGTLFFTVPVACQKTGVRGVIVQAPGVVLGALPPTSLVN